VSDFPFLDAIFSPFAGALDTALPPRSWQGDVQTFKEWHALEIRVQGSSKCATEIFFS